MVVTAQQILDVLSLHREELRKLGVRHIGLFGSYSRGEANPDSDMDILVSLDHPSFNDYATLNNFLEELLGHNVDLVLERSIRPVLRPYILRDVIYAEGI